MTGGLSMANRISRSDTIHNERDASAAVTLVVLVLILGNVILVASLASP
jgi:hypothetical protein